MNKKTNTIFLIVCAVLAVALLLSVTALTSAKSEAKAATEQVRTLIERVQALEEHNQTLQAQLDAKSTVLDIPQIESAPVNTDDFYCTLAIDAWSAKNGILAVDAFAQAVLAEGVNFTAQLELWRGDAVLESQEILLDIGEAEGIFEADITGAAFQLPEIDAEEELQLWLMVKPSGSEALFTCGAGWYLEEGQLMLITG